MIEKALIKEIEIIFSEKMFECETQSGDTLMCSINEAFVEFHEDGHNCLGCNLQDQATLISDFLGSADVCYSKIHFFTIYNLLLYLLTERILEIKKIIGLPSGYKEDKFRVLKEVKLWANFLKHPKAFILTHHPKYVFNGEDYERDSKKIIDFEYILKYYSGEDINKYKVLVRELRNNKNVLVELPDLKRLTHDFCEACKEFIDIIKENKAYREILNDMTTLEHFFEFEELNENK
jgi:hypothetical protein